MDTTWDSKISWYIPIKYEIYFEIWVNLYLFRLHIFLITAKISFLLAFIHIDQSMYRKPVSFLLFYDYHKLHGVLWYRYISWLLFSWGWNQGVSLLESYLEALGKHCPHRHSNKFQYLVPCGCWTTVSNFLLASAEIHSHLHKSPPSSKAAVPYLIFPGI